MARKPSEAQLIIKGYFQHIRSSKFGMCSCVRYIHAGAEARVENQDRAVMQIVAKYATFELNFLRRRQHTLQRSREALVQAKMVVNLHHCLQRDSSVANRKITRKKIWRPSEGGYWKKPEI